MFKTFFKGFNSSRALTLLFLAASIFLGYRAYTNQERITAMENTLASRNSEGKLEFDGAGTIAGEVLEIKKLATQFTALREQLDDEAIQGEESPLTYIRETGFKETIELGDLDISRKDNSVGAKLTDTVFTIRPEDRDKTYHRSQISNFLFTLENDSSRVRVTRVEIRQPKTRSDWSQIPDDRWQFDCDLTMRERTE